MADNPFRDDPYRDLAELEQKRERAINSALRISVLKSFGFIILLVQFMFNALLYAVTLPLWIVILANLSLSLLAIVAYFFSALDTERRMQYLEAGGLHGPDAMNRFFGAPKR